LETDIKKIKLLLSSSKNREDGLELLKVSGYRNAASLASKYLDDGDSFVRQLAIECISERGGKRYGEQVANKLYDNEELVRIAAIEYLVENKVRKCDEISKLLKDDSDLVRAYSGWALGMFHYVRALEEIKNIFKNEKDDLARSGLAEGLFYLTKDESYFQTLLDLFHTNYGEERNFIMNSLTGVAISSPKHKEIVRNEFLNLLNKGNLFEGEKDSIVKNLEELD